MIDDIEIWKDVVGLDLKYPYQCSNLGRFKSFDSVDGRGHPRKGKFLTPTIESNGYHQIGFILKIGKQKRFLAHRVIANAFIDNELNKPFINHKNGIKTDNKIENLEWCTRSENEKHAFSTGLNNNKGDFSPRRKINSVQAAEIKVKFNTGTYTKKRLADEYSITPGNIWYILKEKTWV